MLEELEIAYERVDTDEVITMEDCQAINKKLDMKMVKTLFLTNRQRTQFYLFITEGDKAFKTKAFIQALGIARVSFADEDDFHKLLQTEIGAATIYSACSDGTTRGYMKVKTQDI